MKKELFPYFKNHFSEDQIRSSSYQIQEVYFRAASTAWKSSS